jgi:glycosyltransferase involved in cell wall biosynthesis
MASDIGGDEMITVSAHSPYIGTAAAAADPITRKVALTSLSVVIPAYNVECYITGVLERVLDLRPTLAAFGIAELEVLVVDDASSDRTVDLVRHCHGVTLVRHPRTRGYAAALRSGFSAASGAMLAALDTDGVYPPQYLPELCRCVQDGADLAISTHLSDVKSVSSFMRGLGTLLAGGRAHDGGMRAMRVLRRDALTRLYPPLEGSPATVALRSRRAALNVVHVPVPCDARAAWSRSNTAAPSFS